MNNTTRGKRGGIRARICKEPMIWHGFRLRRGDIFGAHKGEEIVFNGKIRSAKRRDGTVYGVQILIFTHPHIYAWEPNQSISRDDWVPRWIDCGSGIGKKFLSKHKSAQKDGILPGSDYASDEPAHNAFYFRCDKSRFDEAAKRSYYFDCQIGGR